MIREGEKFPDFALKDQSGKIRRLSEFQGKWLAVYFYPKDDTPGCTLEGQAFSKARPKFEKAGAEILGVSVDDSASHTDFCNKYSLNLTLLADTEGALYRACGIGQSEYKGVAYWDRTTLLVDPKGTVRRVYAKVSVSGHEEAVYSDLLTMQQTS